MVHLNEVYQALRLEESEGDWDVASMGIDVKAVTHRPTLRARGIYLGRPIDLWIAAKVFLRDIQVEEQRRERQNREATAAILQSL